MNSLIDFIPLSDGVLSEYKLRKIFVYVNQRSVEFDEKITSDEVAKCLTVRVLKGTLPLKLKYEFIVENLEIEDDLFIVPVIFIFHPEIGGETKIHQTINVKSEIKNWYPSISIIHQHSIYNSSKRSVSEDGHLERLEYIYGRTPNENFINLNFQFQKNVISSVSTYEILKIQGDLTTSTENDIYIISEEGPKEVIIDIGDKDDKYGMVKIDITTEEGQTREFQRYDDEELFEKETKEGDFGYYEKIIYGKRFLVLRYSTKSHSWFIYIMKSIIILDQFLWKRLMKIHSNMKLIHTYHLAFYMISM